MDVADAAGRLRAIRELRWLWLQLAHATRLWGAACSLALAHLLLFCMAAVLLSVFGIAVPLLRGQPLDDRQAGMVVAILHNGHNIASVCGTGNRLRRQVCFQVDPFPIPPSMHCASGQALFFDR